MTRSKEISVKLRIVDIYSVGNTERHHRICQQKLLIAVLNVTKVSMTAFIQHLLFYDIFKCIFLNENVWISNKISLEFVPNGQINNIPTLVQTMARRRPCDKPLSEPMMVSLLTHSLITRSQQEFVSSFPISDNPVLVQVIAWCRTDTPNYRN